MQFSRSLCQGEGGPSPALNGKAKFCGFLCRVSYAPQIAIVMPLRRRHNDMTTVYFMYKVAAVGLPLANSYARPVRCKSAWVLVMTSRDARAEGARWNGVRFAFAALLHYYIWEEREPPRAPHTVLICRSSHMALSVPLWAFVVEESRLTVYYVAT